MPWAYAFFAKAGRIINIEDGIPLFVKDLFEPGKHAVSSAVKLQPPVEEGRREPGADEPLVAELKITEVMFVGIHAALRKIRHGHAVQILGIDIEDERLWDKMDVDDPQAHAFQSSGQQETEQVHVGIPHVHADADNSYAFSHTRYAEWGGEKIISRTRLELRISPVRDQGRDRQRRIGRLPARSGSSRKNIGSASVRSPPFTPSSFFLCVRDPFRRA